MSDWHILGAGAIGCLFAANLQEAGARCCLVLRDAPAPSCDIQIETPAGRRTTAVSATSARASTPIRRLLVTTKAYDVEGALQSVRHRLGGGSEVLIMVNGMGLLEIAAAMLPEVTLFAATTTEGAYRTGPYQVCHAGRGTTRIGQPGNTDEAEWFGNFRDMALACQWDADIEAALWHKLAINCAINPLTALHRVRNGELARDTALRAAVIELCREIAAVSEAAGFGEIAGKVSADVLDVIHRTADNKSSMLQDVLAGQASEIEFITGYLVGRADKLGVAVDRNRELLERMRDREP